MSKNVSEWIKWNGGERPVDKGVDVEVRYRDGTLERCKDYGLLFDWRHHNHSSDVVEYRIWNTYKKPKSGDDLAINLIFSQPTHNGHLQTGLTKASLSQLSSLMDKIDNSGRIRCWCELRLIRDENGWGCSLYAVGEWLDGEHHLGQKDKLLLSISQIDMET